MTTKIFLVIGIMWIGAMSEDISNGIRASNVLGGADEHASFSFVRPGLTQTSYSFNGPSSHQSFSSSIGNPNLAHRVLPNVAQALAYRNPGLGYYSHAPISMGFATSPYVQSANGIRINSGPSTSGLSYQQRIPLDQAATQAYINQYELHAQQQTREPPTWLQQRPYYPELSTYQAQLGQLLALRNQQQYAAQLQLQSQSQGQVSRNIIPVHETSQIPEQLQLQQTQPQSGQSLIGVAYSSAPAAAHVKVSGNGYKFDF